MKNLVFILILLLLFSCNKSNRRVVVEPFDSIKIVEVTFNSDVIPDTTFIVPVEIHDSLILLRAKFIEDSLYREFQIDSTKFRRTTLLINGGYNGWDDRYQKWLQARKALQLYTP